MFARDTQPPARLTNTGPDRPPESATNAVSASTPNRAGAQRCALVRRACARSGDFLSALAVLLANAGTLATGALFSATHPSRTTALVVLEGYADPMAQRTNGLDIEEVVAAMVAMWGTGEFQHVLNPDMPWNEEIRATWARHERLAASPGTVALVMPLVTEVDVRALLPSVRVPTLVVQHADDPFIPPAWGKFVADRIPGAKYVELPGCNLYHYVTRSQRPLLHVRGRSR